MRVVKTQEREIPEDIPSAEDVRLERPTQGITCWTNPNNRFRVVRLHYTADPKKRGQDWKAETIAGLPSYDYWLREFEMVLQSFQGKPVYFGEWSHEFHVSKEPLKHSYELPIIRGWDVGLSPACLFTQLMPRSKLYILRELVTEGGTGIEQLIDMVMEAQLKWFPGHTKYLDVVDPSGFYRRDTDARSCVNIMTGRPPRASPLPGVQVPQQRKSDVVALLRKNVQGQPCYLVDPRAETIIKGFDGGFHYAYSREGALRDRWEKNIYSHIHEANQYICTRLNDLNTRASELDYTFKEPKYDFGKQAQGASVTIV